MSAQHSVFNKPYRAFLFDMDGTVLNSIAAAERIWTTWALRHGVDVDAFLPTIHGARAIDTVNRQALPGVDAEAEAAWITQAEIEDVEGIVEVGRAAEFLTSLPAGQWAIVTSAPRALALRRMAASFSRRSPASRSASSGGTDGGATGLAVVIGDCVVTRSPHHR